MKEELQGKLVEILTSIQTAAGKASDFALEQLPDIAQSYVTYGRVSSLAGVLIGTAVLIGVLLFARWLWALNKAAGYRNEPIGLNVFGGMTAAFVAVFGAVLLISSLNTALLVWFAPKVWLLKEIATLLK